MSLATPRLLLLCLGLPLASFGCSSSTSPQRDTSTADSRAADGPSFEGGTGDLRPANDGPLHGHDHGIDGMRADGTAADMTNEGPAADAAPAHDKSQLPGCSGGAEGLATGETDVVACIAPTTASQCEASNFCASGWHLCTASAYRTGRQAALPAAVTESLWLAGCARDGAAPSAPFDQVCSSCEAGTGSEVTVGWSCVNSAVVISGRLRIGVRTSDACSRIGVNSDATATFWQAWPASQGLRGALCCRD